MRESHVLVRPPLRADEWSETYLAAVVRDFGIERPHTYDIDRMRFAFGWTAVDGGSLTRRSYVQGRPQYGFMPLPEWATVVRAMPLRYCPVCFSLGRYFKTRWRITSLEACTTHACLFKTDLAEPGLTANYDSRRLLRLDRVDAAQIMSGATCCLPSERRAVDMVWAQFEAKAEGAVEPRVDDALGEAAAWSLLLWRSLEVVARAHHRQVLGQPTFGSLAGVGRLVRDLKITVAPTWEGMLSLFEALRQRANVVAMQQFLRWIKQMEERRPSVISRLPLDDLDERLTAMQPQAQIRTSHGKLAYRELSAETLKVAEVLNELKDFGAGTDVVHGWLRRKVLRAVRRRSGRVVYMFVDREEVHLAKQFLLSLVHARDFVAQHGLDWGTYEALRALQFFGPVIPGMRGHIRRRCVQSLISRLELMSRPADAYNSCRWGLISRTTLKAARQREVFGSFIEAALQGGVPVYRDSSRPGLSAFSIDQEGLRWLSARRRGSLFRRLKGSAPTQTGLFGPDVGDVDSRACRGLVLAERAAHRPHEWRRSPPRPHPGIDVQLSLWDSL